MTSATTEGTLVSRTGSQCGWLTDLAMAVAGILKGKAAPPGAGIVLKGAGGGGGGGDNLSQGCLPVVVWW